jgi:hypothetical protein
MTDPNYDPLEAYESVPSISFDPGRGGVAEGEWVTLEVTDYIKLVQDRDDKGNLKTYEDSGKPMMKFVLPVKLDGEDRTLWGPVLRKYDTALFYQLIEAQKAVREKSGDPARRLGPGCTIRVRWAWNTSLPKKMGNHPKKYAAELVSVGAAPPPKNDPLAKDDPWSSTPVPAAAGEPPFAHRTGFEADPQGIFV